MLAMSRQRIELRGTEHNTVAKLTIFTRVGCLMGMARSVFRKTVVYDCGIKPVLYLSFTIFSPLPSMGFAVAFTSEERYQVVIEGVGKFFR